MKNKMKKLLVTFLLGITLCGGVMTAQAATNGCGHSSTNVTETKHIVTYTHPYMVGSVAYECTVTVPCTKVVVTCRDCGAVLVTQDNITGTPSHSVQH